MRARMLRSPLCPVLNGSDDASAGVGLKSDQLLNGGKDQDPEVLLHTLQLMLSFSVPFGTRPVLSPGLLLQ